MKRMMRVRECQLQAPSSVASSLVRSFSHSFSLLLLSLSLLSLINSPLMQQPISHETYRPLTTTAKTVVVVMISRRSAHRHHHQTSASDWAATTTNHSFATNTTDDENTRLLQLLLVSRQHRTIIKQAQTAHRQFPPHPANSRQFYNRQIITRR